MKTWMCIVWAICLCGAVTAVCIKEGNRLGREDEVYELITEISAFAANHGQHLPESWTEFCEYTNPGKANKWSRGWLDSFGSLRWGKVLGDNAPHEPYLSIKNVKYRVFQAEVNEYFNKYDQPQNR
jgi:hypothetical protein